MTNPDYEALREQCAAITYNIMKNDLRKLTQSIEAAISDAILAKVFQTLEKVTPEMHDAGCDAQVPAMEYAWLAMLRASPLNPNKE